MKTNDDTAGAVDKAGDAPETKIQAAETAPAENSSSTDQVAKNESAAGDSAKADDVKSEAAKNRPRRKSRPSRQSRQCRCAEGDARTTGLRTAQGRRGCSLRNSGSEQGQHTRPSDPEKAAVSEAGSLRLALRQSAAARSPYLSARRDGKLYVRQNFAPLFDVAVTIAPSDPPARDPRVHRADRQG